MNERVAKEEAKPRLQHSTYVNTSRSTKIHT